MREPARDIGRLEHILEAIEYVKLYTAGYDCDSLAKDTLHFHATVHNVQIVGEAVYKLSSDFKKEHPLTQWAAIEKMRHVLVHDYYQINYRILWEIVSVDLPALAEQVSGYLSEFQ